MNKIVCFFACLVVTSQVIYSQTATIQIDAIVGQKGISPFIYGRNNSLSDASTSPLASSKWQLYRDAGVKMFRENGGNNATKYNWRLKLSSHPDWYNNVYSHDWDYAAKSLQNNLTGVSCLWAFQLIGKAASNKNNNFADYAYNGSAWWSGVYQNLAGGGVVNSSGGSTATQNGNPDLYLKNWPADSTVGILNHWFGAGGLGLNNVTFRYWNMDNEPEIWKGTHDDVMPTQVTAEAFMQRYFEVAKKARAIYPGIKLVGPVPCNEWQWYNWDDNLVLSNGIYYTWLEFFIKRIAEEQVSSGIRLLDVLDLHFYPGESTATDIVQLHRVFFDKTYNYPGANGLYKINGGWDTSIKKEYIFERCNTWLNNYIGANHGVTFSVSEMDVNTSDANVIAIWYASMLGTFADKGVEIFTPWSWETGMWETIHLFSRYAKDIRVQSTSNQETYVSAYSSISSDLDSLTVILVNRSTTQTYTTSVNLSNILVNNGNYNTLTLSNLPGTETFTSHTQNHLNAATVAVSNNAFSVSLAPLSMKAVLIAGSTSSTIVNKLSENLFEVSYMDSRFIEISYKIAQSEHVQLELYDIQGKKVSTLENSRKSIGNYTKKCDYSDLHKGIYILRFTSGSSIKSKKLNLD